MNDSSAPTCRPILTKISAYLDGELEARACDEIKRHCEHCASCRELVKGLRQTMGLCRRVAEAPLPNAVRQRARARVQRLLDRDRR
jgi:anti-sigma factor RsiW